MDYASRRKALVRSLVERGYISKENVIKAMEKVERHIFVPEHLREYAYYDQPLEIGHGQTISAPHMVGIMVEKLELEEGNKVLEIGGGSGYHAAVVAEIIGNGHVYTVERIEELGRRAKENLKNAGLENKVSVFVGDGSLGLQEHAPYDRIFVSCASPSIPPPLIEQLRDPGKLLIPVGRDYQELILFEKSFGKIIKKNYGGCVFVPLIGKYGF
ncbi:MAG: protein-L-isoaspartate O-methyltransferase [Candidatus Thermoplasmatota archaeon]